MVGLPKAFESMVLNFEDHLSGPGDHPFPIEDSTRINLYLTH